MSIIGQKFGSLTIIDVVSATYRASATDRSNPKLRYVYKAQCSCGCVVEIRDSRLHGKKAKRRCPNCAAHTQISPYTPEQRALRYTWREMMRRCYEPSNHNYARYGGRGIFVCDRWHVFRNFAEDMAPRPEGRTLERTDNDGPYSPGNCRWATAKEQAANRRQRAVFPWKGLDRADPTC